MKILICGSASFRKEKVEIKDRLKLQGHDAFLDDLTQERAKNDFKEDENKLLEEKTQYIKWYNEAIIKSDAILVVNIDKNNIKGYIGGNTFLEIGFAFVNDKKIYLLSEIPKMPYEDEIKAMKPIIIKEDLKKIR